MDKELDLLLEIGTEEIPARFIPDALAQLRDQGKELLAQARLAHGKLETSGTPRRLILYIHDLAPKAADLELEVKGPPQKVAFEADGNPTKAALGFARNQGVSVADLKVKELDGGLYLFACRKELGRPARELAPQILEELVTGINFPKAMRWGNNDLRFARPIRWLVALLGQEVIPFSIAGVASGRRTFGHRFLSKGSIELAEPREYHEKMRQHYVLIDPQEREQLIREQAEEIVKKEAGKVLWDKELLAEVVNLVEYPTVFMGSFDHDFLELPTEVVITPMKEHQRYFPVADLTGELLPRFIAVRNGTDDNIAIVREGNEKVLRARLADAQFFYNEDKKTPLAERLPQLQEVVFLEGLGSVYDKVERLQDLAAFIVENLGLDEPVRSLVQRTVTLSKNDLVTKMVNEFSELQGVMGREYALLDGENPVVAQGIYEHYLPRFAGDELPQTMVGKVASIADKLDSICGCFGVGIIPTGSQDPYALRRQAYGIVNILLHSDLNLKLSSLVEYALAIYQSKGLLSGETAVVKEQVLAFFAGRIKNALSERGFSYDSIEAVMATDYDNVSQTLNRVEAISKLRQQPEFTNILTVFTRIHNLARQTEAGSKYVAELLQEPAEQKLYTSFRQIKPKLERALQAQDYVGGIKALSELQPVLEAFFNEVLVMAEDKKLQVNRLALLKELDQLFLTIADFSQIVA
ncbi:MAG: glycine--tRNA ligase subunit beta [bacterium]|jgi:glycyl-tRNA synthetase beta chain